MEAAGPWEVVEMAGQKLPGTCTLTVAPEQIRITQRIYTREQLHELWRVLPSIQEGTARALDISHPALDVMGVRSAMLIHVTLLHPTSVQGVFEMEYDLRPVKAP